MLQTGLRRKRRRCILTCAEQTQRITAEALALSCANGSNTMDTKSCVHTRFSTARHPARLPLLPAESNPAPASATPHAGASCKRSCIRASLCTRQPSASGHYAGPLHMHQSARLHRHHTTMEYRTSLHCAGKAHLLSGRRCCIPRQPSKPALHHPLRSPRSCGA